MVALQVEETARYLPESACYLHLPIPDLGVPGREWEANWEAIGPALLDCLQQGQAVLLHCKGGLGRTGTVAARLLVEMGHPPEEAIAAVRKARQGAIENPLQENYVRVARI